MVSLSDKSAPIHDPSETFPTTPFVNAVPLAHVYVNPLLGDALAILAAIFYSLYVILLKAS